MVMENIEVQHEKTLRIGTGKNLFWGALATLPLLLVGCGGLGVSEEENAPSYVNPDRAFIDARAELLEGANGADPLVRAHAMEALGQTFGTKEAGVLLQGLSDRYVIVQYASAMALADVVYPPAREKLRRMADRGETLDDRVLCAVILALHRLGDDTHAGKLGKILF